MEISHENFVAVLIENLDNRSIVQLEKSTTKQEKHEENGKLTLQDPNKSVTFNEVEIIRQSSDFIVCIKINFVIKVDEEIEVFIVEFKSSGIGKSYYLKVIVKFWKIKEECFKVN